MGIRARSGTVNIHGNVTATGLNGVGIYTSGERSTVNVSSSVTATLRRAQVGRPYFGFSWTQGADTITIGGQVIQPDEVATGGGSGQQPPTTPPSGGNGGSSGSDRDSDRDTSSSTPAPSPRALPLRIPANDGGVSIRVRISDNSAILSLPTSVLNALVNSAEYDIITLDLTYLEDIESVAISRTAMRRFANEGLGLEIIMPQGIITFSAEAVYEIGQLARHARITAEIVAIEDDLEVAITSGARVISDFEGVVTVVQPDDKD